jgi:hypothetical protein
MVTAQLLPTVKPQVRAHKPKLSTNLNHAGQIPLQRIESGYAPVPSAWFGTC